MDGYDESTYGDAFADVYDDWYQGVSDVVATVEVLGNFAGEGPVLELGVGTGRLALPLAERGIDVVGVDASRAMLDRLSERDPAGLVTAVHGDMLADLPDGPFGLVFVAYNTLFNLTADGAHAACFVAVHARLAPGGRFVVEAFVPDESLPAGDDVSIRSLAADRVILSINRRNPSTQRAEGQFVELSEQGGVRLRPWSIRYATPAQLDAVAGQAGFELEHRWEDFERRPFSEASPRHVSIYRRR